MVRTRKIHTASTSKYILIPRATYNVLATTTGRAVLSSVAAAAVAAAAAAATSIKAGRRREMGWGCPAAQLLAGACVALYSLGTRF